MREEIGWDNKLMVDANQKWGVARSHRPHPHARPAHPYWMEEPTSPDDILGHARIRREAAPVRIATGEHCHNRVMFKQLLQAGAIDVCQIDSLPRRRRQREPRHPAPGRQVRRPVCPHAGGVGLCEYVQHLSFFDYLRVSSSTGGPRHRVRRPPARAFPHPGRIRRGRYMPPHAPGYSIQMHPESLSRYAFPNGAEWIKPGQPE